VVAAQGQRVADPTDVLQTRQRCRVGLPEPIEPGAGVDPEEIRGRCAKGDHLVLLKTERRVLLADIGVGTRSRQLQKEQASRQHGKKSSAELLLLAGNDQPPGAQPAAQRNRRCQCRQRGPQRSGRVCLRDKKQPDKEQGGQRQQQRTDLQKSIQKPCSGQPLRDRLNPTAESTPIPNAQSTSARRRARSWSKKGKIRVSQPCTTV
jgi:hypothetical protein